MHLSPLVIFLAILGSLCFLAAEFYHQKISIHPSIVAGISIAYVFFRVLPEVFEGLQDLNVGLKNGEFFFILFGFTFYHMSEKLILQRVENKNQEKIRSLMKMQKNIDIVQDLISKSISDELLEKHEGRGIDMDVLQELGSTLNGLLLQEKDIKNRYDKNRAQIQAHINEDLDKLQDTFTFSYHIIIGFLLVDVLTIDIFSGILFFFFTIFMAIVSKDAESNLIFSDLDIAKQDNDSNRRKLVLGISALIGTLISILLDKFDAISTGTIFILFSFISGVLLYKIIKHVIPEKEKGKPFYFLTSLIVFVVVLILFS